MPELAIRTEPILVSRETAAALLGVSLTFFKDQIAPDVPCVRASSSKVLYRVRSLEIWAAKHETLGGQGVRATG